MNFHKLSRKQRLSLILSVYKDLRKVPVSILWKSLPSAAKKNVAKKLSAYKSRAIGYLIGEKNYIDWGI